MQTATLTQDEELTGWGLYHTARCRVARPDAVEQLRPLLAEAGASGATVAPRGAGCSYGDAALNGGEIVLDCTGLNRVLAWNAATGIATVEPGVTIAQLWRKTLPDGWWPDVVPGTSAVTIGGAAAMDVHGKNNWHAGSFGDTVLAFDLLLPDGATVSCSRDERPELFRAALGGLGMLGVFTSLTLRTRRVFSGTVWEITTAHASLAELVAALEAATSWATDIVAWVDTSARGRQLGRGLLKMSRDLTADEEPNPRKTLREAFQMGRRPLAARLPEGWLQKLTRPMTTPAGVWLANRGQWVSGQGIRHRRPHLTPYVAANFPLDAIPGWRETYRPGGLLQHQAFVPAASAVETFCEILERSQRAGQTPSFAVLKKHRASPYGLSCLLDGYSLALDFPVRASGEQSLRSLLSSLNELVAETGGRVYFAKDSMATSEQVERMYGAQRLREFAARKAEYDPGGLLASDLYRRAIAPAAD